MAESCPADKEQRGNIPLPVQREVRQRCGFGCVICGLPLYEYEHMRGWANVEEHVAEDITLLCTQHHTEKTNGLLPLEKVREADADPWNYRIGVTKPYDLHYSGQSCEVAIGGNTFTTVDEGYGTQCIPVMVDGVPLLGFLLTDEHLLLNVNLFDEANEMILRVINNALEYSVEPWDVEFVGRNLVIRAGARNIFIDITFDTPNRIVVNRGRLLCNGVELFLRPDYALLVNNSALLRGCEFSNVSVGLNIGADRGDHPAGIKIGGVPRYGIDRSKSFAWARQQLRRAR